MRAIFLTSILILSVIASYSQEPTKAVSAEMRKHAHKVLLETPHRVKMTVEMRDTIDSAWEPYSSQTREVINPDRWHLVQHTGLKLELIGIGDRTYQKMPDGSWQLRPKGSGYTGPTVTQVSRPVTGLATMRESSDGRSTVVESSEQSTLQVNRTGEVVDMNRKTKEWFDDSGRLIRVVTEHNNFERKKFQRVTDVYEYDSTIRIEEPVKTNR